MRVSILNIHVLIYVLSKRDYELGNNEKYTDEFFHKIFEINTLK